MLLSLHFLDPLQALGLVNLGEQGQQLGLIVGGTTCAIVLALSLKRCFDTS